jgi:adenylate cyclase
LELWHEWDKSFTQNEIRFFSLVADQIATQVVLFRIYHQMLKEEKRRLTLSRFFSNTVADKIVSGGDNLELGGERKKVTIVFADLRGFTTMSEALDQEEVVAILNAYFSVATPIVFLHDGTLDKLMGDGIMAFFGAPISHEDDALRAVKTAIELKRALQIFNKTQRHTGWPHLDVSIGINTGEVVAGYIGSQEHLNYTVIGDAVNTAQRLQSIAGTNTILISKVVYEEIETQLPKDDMKISIIPMPAQKLKGKETITDIYKVEGKTPAENA